MRYTTLVRSRTTMLLVALVVAAALIPAIALAYSPGDRFIDDDGNPHEAAIEALADEGITKGCNPPYNNRYCPADKLTRGEAASLLDRALGLPNTSKDFFSDDNNSIHEDSINRMAAAGITEGCGDGRFCAWESLTRGEAASLFDRALNLSNTSTDYFDDDDSSIHEGAINRIAKAGITNGCDPTDASLFCPTKELRRDEVASLVARAFDLDLTPIPPPPPPHTVIWRGDVETGDVSQWRSVSVSGKADVQVVTSPTRSGRYALRLNNWDVDGSHNAGVRMNLQGPFGEDPENLPNDGYYSAWYYIPFVFEGHSNIFQYKQSDVTKWSGGEPSSHTRRMLWKVGLYYDGADSYDLEIRTRINQSTGQWQSSSMRLGIVDVDIPIGKWFHIETRYKWGENGTGHTTVWLDGQKVWDTPASTQASNLTCMHRCREWVVSHYLSDYQGYVAPGDSWIYIDDAKLATGRVGNG